MFLLRQIEENLGMVLVFTVVSAAIEWLGSKNEELKIRREEEARLKKEREEEAERVRQSMNWARLDTELTLSPLSEAL